jgi:L-lysine 2,3-aminomutase
MDIIACRRRELQPPNHPDAAVGEGTGIILAAVLRRRENAVTDGMFDPLDEDADSPVPNITHRYPDRVLFLVSPFCAAYCRFCTRRRKVGDPEKFRSISSCRLRAS